MRRIFCAVKSVSSAALLGVMQGRDTKPGAKETSKTVLRKFPRKSDISPKGSVTVPFGEMIFSCQIFKVKA